MAQLRDLLVNGASRFLGVVNFNDEAIFNKGVTLNETLTLLKNTDANGGTYNSPALVIGDKEVEGNLVTYRKHGSQEQITVTLEEFYDKILKEIAERKANV